MRKSLNRSYSRYSQDAGMLMGQLIRQARIERKMTVEDLAQRLGASRGLVHRIEKGDPACASGTLFEAAAIAGVRLFDADQDTMANAVSTNARMLALMPKAVRTSRIQVKDDF